MNDCPAPDCEVRCQNPRCRALLGTRTARGFTPAGSRVCLVRASRIECLKCLREQRVYGGPLVQK